MDTAARSLLKTLSYRFIASAITAGLVLLLTGRWGLAAGAGIIDSCVKLFVYFLHERAWNAIPSGAAVQASPEEVAHEPGLCRGLFHPSPNLMPGDERIEAHQQEISPALFDALPK